MSSVVLMKILESAPDRYDVGMRVLSLGAISRAHRLAAELAVERPDARVLEMGCGTGMVTERLLGAGARVEAFDQNPEMLDRARERFAAAGEGRLSLRESTAAEMDALPEAGYDAVVASLVLSEMSSSERGFVLRQVARVLRPSGRFVVVDEVVPRRGWQRLLHLVVRLPLALLAWVVTGTTTHAIADIIGELGAAGLRVASERRSRLGTLAVVAAERAA